MNEETIKNMRDKFVSSNFDQVDMVMDTDRRFDEAIAAADAGEEDLVDVIAKDMTESGIINTIVEDDLTQYNPEDLDSNGILDDTADDYHEYVSEEDYDDDYGDIIDCIMGDAECEEC